MLLNSKTALINCLISAFFALGFVKSSEAQLSATLSASNTNCFGSNDGSINAVATGGILNQVLCFDGTDDYINLDVLNQVDFSNGITIETWVKPEIPSGDGVVFAVNTTGGGNVFIVSYNALLQQFIYFDDNVGNQIQTGTSPNNQWHHLALSISASNQVTMVVNGVQVGTFAIPPGWLPNNQLISIGQEYDGVATSQHFQGCMDDFRVWNSPLSLTDIQGHYNNHCGGLLTTDPNNASLVMHYKFNQTGITLITDESGNGYDGTYNGTSWNLADYGCFITGDGYGYDWSNGANSPSITGLTSGNYTLTLFDGDGNSFVDVAMVMEPAELTGIENSDICGGESIIVNGTTYDAMNSMGTEVFTGIGTNGCDSTVTVNLNVLLESSATDIISTCDSLLWIDGNTYTTSNNTATYVLQNAVGCDSTVTLDLTINNSTTGTDVVTACDSFTWIDGNTYTSSNNSATFTLQNAQGCDSLVTLDLTVLSVDVSLTNLSPVLEANLTGATYQWLDCNNGFSFISGETSQTFTATVNGTYAVIVTANNCSDTSECIVVDNVNLEELEMFGFEIFPNPTNETFFINISSNIEGAQLLVTDVNGRPVHTENVESKLTQIDAAVWASGIYIVKLSNNSFSQTRRIVIKH